MDTKDTFTWEYDKFDSEILERRVAKITSLDSQGGITQRKNLVKILIESLKKKDIEYATYRIRASEFLTIHALEEYGFRLVDGIISLEQFLREPEKTVERTIRKASSGDIESLQRLASETFSGTRFYNDPLIKKHQADKIYSEWIKNSVEGRAADMVFLWEEGEGPVGFVTLRKTGGSIILIAVSRKHQGKGIGKALVKVALNQFLKWGLEKATVETQMTNVAALRFYLSCGYKIVNAYFTLRWSK